MALLGNPLARPLVIAALCLLPSLAAANGRSPAADYLAVNPNISNKMMLRTTWGLLQTVDSGRTWQWVCESAVGFPPTYTGNPPLDVLADGTQMMGTFSGSAFNGFSVSRNGGCDWTLAGGIFGQALMQDFTQDPSNPANEYALSCNYAGGNDYTTIIGESTNFGQTWQTIAQSNAALDNSTPGQVINGIPGWAISLTIEVARSNPNRIYVTADDFRTGYQNVLLRSEDHGATWVYAPIPLAADWATTDSINARAYVSGVDPNNADIVYVRLYKSFDKAYSSAIGVNLDSPSTLLVSTNKGQTWTQLAEVQAPILGFALSPDATKLAYGNLGPYDATGNLLPGGAIYVGPAPFGPFTKVSSVDTRCLRWTAAGIYACGSEPVDPFTLGLSTDGGHTFVPKYTKATTCQLTCPANSKVASTCPALWSAGPPNGVAYNLGNPVCPGGGGAPGCGTPASIAPAPSLNTPVLATSGVAGIGLLFTALRRLRRRRSRARD